MQLPSPGEQDVCAVGAAGELDLALDRSMLTPAETWKHLEDTRQPEGASVPRRRGSSRPPTTRARVVGRTDGS